MLQIEVRIIPTYEIIANFDMLNSYRGLIIPLIASANAKFLFRHFFLTVLDELLEAALIDEARPFNFFKGILLHLSKVNIAALFVIMFIYGWIQYLWPLIASTDPKHQIVFVVIKQLVVQSL